MATTVPASADSDGTRTARTAGRAAWSPGRGAPTIAGMADPAPAPGETRRVFARAEGLWYLRHAAVLARWPILAESWARRVESRRLEGATPGAAGPGRAGPPPPRS